VSPRRYTDYDAFAWFYNRYWGGFSSRALPVLDRLVLGNLPPGATILDLCCGAGHLASILTARGFCVVGVDGSSEMLAFARENAPQAQFVLADAREFRSPEAFDAALCLFDSLNHIMSLDELEQVFANVYASLVPGGTFVFDLNMETGYRSRWNGSMGLAREDHALIARSSYDVETRTGRMDLTMFRLIEGAWHRSDVTLTQRAYEEGEVREALGRAGFREVAVLDAERDLQMPTGAGRSFFVAVRPLDAPDLGLPHHPEGIAGPRR